MNKIKAIIVGLIIALFAYHTISYGQTSVTEKLRGVTATGITSYTSKTSSGMKFAKEAVIFTDYNPGTSTAVYNNAGGLAAASGWINVTDFNDDIIYRVDLATLGSSGLDVTFEGLLGDIGGDIIDIYTKSFSAVDTTYNLSIAEGGLKYVRAGLQATGTEGTDSVSISFRAEGVRK